jgi:hypothetical protein
MNAMPRRRWLGSCLLGVWCLFTAGDPASAQNAAPVCNPRLVPQDGPLGYRVRGDRCEGLYETLVALGTIQPVSLVLAEQPIPLGLYRLTWSRTATMALVHVQAVTFKPDVFYRMDAQVKGSEYRWPTDLLRQLGIQANELGVLATREETINGQPQPVYLPVDLRGAGSSPRGRYALRVATSEDLAELYLSVTGPIAAGQAGKPLVAERRIGGPYRSSTAPIWVPLDLSPAEPGLYQVRLAGKLANRGGGTTSSFYLRHER